MILGIDPGGRRIGVAIADEETRFARPLEVIDSRDVDPLRRIRDIAAAEGVSLVVVGRPVGLSGREGPAVRAQRAFTEELRAAVDVDIVEHDERLSTVVAERSMRAAGADARARRGKRDAVAAQVMLQGYLDSRRAGGRGA